MASGGYSDSQKALACHIIRSKHDGSVTTACVDEIRKTLDEPNLPRATINRWWFKFKAIAVNRATINLPQGQLQGRTDAKKDAINPNAGHKGVLNAPDALNNFISNQIVINAEEISRQRKQMAQETPLDIKLERAAHKFIDHAVQDELLMWTNSKDAILAAAMAIDRMQLLRNIPPEIVSILPQLVEAYNNHGEKFVNILNKIILRLSIEFNPPNSDSIATTAIPVPALNANILDREV